MNTYDLTKPAHLCGRWADDNEGAEGTFTACRLPADHVGVHSIGCPDCGDILTPEGACPSKAEQVHLDCGCTLTLCEYEAALYDGGKIAFGPEGLVVCAVGYGCGKETDR